MILEGDPGSIPTNPIIEDIGASPSLITFHFSSELNSLRKLD